MSPRIAFALFASLIFSTGIASPIPVARHSGETARPLPAPAEFLTDCNHNGIEDSVDIAFGTSSDVDDDGIPDECQSCETPLGWPGAQGGRD